MAFLQGPGTLLKKRGLKKKNPMRMMGGMIEKLKNRRLKARGETPASNDSY